MNNKPRRNYDIFCTVIDNYGDIATCWRLACQLQQRHEIDVRIWVDDLTALQPLVPQTQLDRQSQCLNAIQVCHWTQPFSFDYAADVVIEAFGCELPSSYRQAMLKQQSLCINLEYFSCEDWVLGCHGLRSFQADGLHKYFFFPGLTSGTGGVLYEADYEAQRLNFNEKAQHDWFEQWQLPRLNVDSLRISLFGYENKSIIDLLEQASNMSIPIEFYCPMNKLCHHLATFLGNNAIQSGNSHAIGNAHLHLIPFLPQTEYDRLLWCCDLNLVRGEESLIRGLLAVKPLVWHIYPTDDQAHWIKLKAFLKVSQLDSTLAALNTEWNAQETLTHFNAVIAALPQLTQQAQTLQQTLLSQADLSTQLVTFIEHKLNNT